MPEGNNDDQEKINFSKTRDYKYLLDSEMIYKLEFDVKNGKKVYGRFAGVNQPLEQIN